jgi:hypothetical protein
MTQTTESELAAERAAYAKLLERRQRLLTQQAAVSDEALSESSGRIAAIEARLAAEQTRSRARDAAGHLGEFRRLANACDDALMQLTASYEALKALAHEMRLACGAPHARSFQLASINCVASALVQSDLRTELVPPGRRRTFTQNALEWAKSVETAASGRIEQ